jgi:hypothetical protein
MRSCDETAALQRLAELLECPEETEEASRVADEALRRYLGRTRGDRSSG